MTVRINIHPTLLLFDQARDNLVELLTTWTLDTFLKTDLDLTMLSEVAAA